MISAIDKPETTFKLLEIVQKKYPHIHLMVLAKNRYDAYALINMGIEHIYRESLDTSVKLATDVLSKMGFRKYTLHLQAPNFIDFDEKSLRRLASQPRQDVAYIFEARAGIKQQEKRLEDDFKRGLFEDDAHWHSEQMKLTFDKGDEG